MKRKITGDSVIGVLLGGIGNQLFVYFAALYLADKLGKNLIVELGGVGVGKTVHGTDISPFKTIGVKRRTRNPFVTQTKAAIRKLVREGIISGKLVQFAYKFHESKSLGFDPELESVSSNVELYGYYQTYKYFDSLSIPREELGFELINPSSEIVEKGHRVDDTMLAVHVRRGDYMLESETFGLLNQDYYLEAISKICKLNPKIQSVTCFSDSPDLAESIIRDLCSTLDLDFSLEAENQNPCDEMYLMSKYANLVIANSSFSYWAALNNSNVRPVVVAPSKWFKGIEDPIDLIPPYWERIASSWFSQT